MCKKHHVWPTSEKLGSSLASLMIIILLHDMLSQVMLRIYTPRLVFCYLEIISMLTFSAIPNSPTTFANTIAKLSLEWDYKVISNQTCWILGA